MRYPTLLLMFATLCLATACAQNYSNKPITGVPTETAHPAPVQPQLTPEAVTDQPIPTVNATKIVTQNRTSDKDISSKVDLSTPTEQPHVQQEVSKQSLNVSNRTNSEVVTKGEFGQVSTIAGNGTQGQGEFTLDHPRFPAMDSKGNVYFLDGSQKTMKLRKWDGNRNETIIDMRTNKVASQEGEFFSTGLQIINETVYFSSEEKVYNLVNGRATELDPAIARWMKDNHYVYIFRMEQYDNDLILMLFRKGDYSQTEYGFIRYKLGTKEVEEVLPAGQYPNPSNFFMQEKGISVTSLTGAIYYEKFFPRQSKDQLDTNMGSILDTWIDNDYIYYAINENKTSFKIYRMTIGGKGSGGAEALGERVAGGYMGFIDGVADEVKMDYPTDFVWDGSGFVFSDRENNAIRKIWIDSTPLNYGDEEE